jgi:GT2 family glycosyltransferase
MLVFFSILYNPDVNALNNIRIAKSLGLHTVIYLNKSEDYFLKQLVGFDIVILGDNINVGLGKAFYEFEKYLQSTTYKYFIYFDQDTVVNDNAWHNIINTYESFYKNKEVGLLNYGNTPKINRHFVISSGSLFSMNILKEIGLQIGRAHV